MSVLLSDNYLLTPATQMERIVRFFRVTKQNSVRFEIYCFVFYSALLASKGQQRRFYAHILRICASDNNDLCDSFIVYCASESHKSACSYFH